MQHFALFARRGELFKKLWEGDPVAWGILAVVVVAMVGWSLYKKQRAANQPKSDTDEQKQ